jgi:hypothetical protein
MRCGSININMPVRLGAISIALSLSACADTSKEHYSGLAASANNIVEPAAVVEKCSYRESISYQSFVAQVLALSMVYHSEAASSEDRARLRDEASKGFLADMKKFEAGEPLSEIAEKGLAMRLKFATKTFSPCELEELRATVWLTDRLSKVLAKAEIQELLNRARTQ